MRILKERTSPISCRVSTDMKYKIEEMADLLGMSLAQYVSLLVTFGQNSDSGLKEAEAKVLEAEVRAQEAERKLENLKDKSHLIALSLTTSLAAVTKNEQILQEAYLLHGDKPLLRANLVERGFQFNYLFQAKAIDKKTYYFMGDYGWTYVNDSRKEVVIKKVH